MKLRDRRRNYSIAYWSNDCWWCHHKSRKLYWIDNTLETNDMLNDDEIIAAAWKWRIRWGWNEALMISSKGALESIQKIKVDSLFISGLRGKLIKENTFFNAN